MPEVTAFVFDCFGVIATPVIRGWYAEYTHRTGKTDPELHSFVHRFDLGELSEEDICAYLASYEGKDPMQVRDEIDSYLSVDMSLVRVIKKLKDHGYIIQLLSNANHHFFERKFFPEHPEVKNLFDSIVISSQVHMTKPGSEIFELALGKIGIQALNAVMVDDTAVNIDTAVGLGMHGIVFTNTEHFIQQLSEMGIKV